MRLVRRQLGGTVAGSVVTAEQAAGNAHWRSCWHMEAAEEEEEGQARQERRQRWQRCTAVVEAIEELCPSTAVWMGEGRGWSRGAAAAGSSNRRCSTGGSSTGDQGERRSQRLEWQQGVLLEVVAEGAAVAAGVAGGACQPRQLAMLRQLVGWQRLW